MLGNIRLDNKIANTWKILEFDAKKGLAETRVGPNKQKAKFGKTTLRAYATKMTSPLFSIVILNVVASL